MNGSTGNSHSLSCSTLAIYHSLVDIRLESIRIPCAFRGFSRLDEAIFSSNPPLVSARKRAQTRKLLHHNCYGVLYLGLRMERQWKAEARRNELTELFRELQLLRLKYEHVIDVCRKLSRTW